MTLLEIMIVLAIIAVVMGFLIGPKVIGMWNKAKEDTTRLIVKKLANEAYSHWTMETGKACPPALSDLQEHTNQKGTKDSWGHELVMFCGDNIPKGASGGFAILSAGPDGKQGTKDDIKSWD